MSKQKPTSQIIRYWHPRLGGWYFGRIVKMDIDDNGNGIVTVEALATKSTLRVAEEDVREVAA